MRSPDEDGPPGKLKDVVEAIYAPSMEPPAGNAFARAAQAAMVAQGIEVWEDNIPAFRLFTTVMTQWRMSLSGPVGLDYGAVYPVMERMRLPDDDWNELLHDLQVMEAKALEIFRSRAKND